MQIFGKQGSFRTTVGHRLIFVHGFAKNEADNITKKEKEALRIAV
ncbi:MULTISPECIES: type II toxin-antitoxin system RelE/ParE family toxin [Rhizobium]|nr:MULTISPECIES: type II toxin-antitoxin system RelE/ParE family toxin [Rhizobium]MCA0805287.1 type II toxin-antitoxin system RelE/ParE family toxin [Rhizobium sp. T1473]MCS0462701.1 type II toxin-antitoxin system RelE/ParE family toxin [Rhizobium favelukesii]UFS79383.1 type II toxin-antitoxin system RelE/ParE family toxin [Rhizobium sp. T136]